MTTLKEFAQHVKTVIEGLGWNKGSLYLYDGASKYIEIMIFNFEPTDDAAIRALCEDKWFVSQLYEPIKSLGCSPKTRCLTIEAKQEIPPTFPDINEVKVRLCSSGQGVDFIHSEGLYGRIYITLRQALESYAPSMFPNATFEVTYEKSQPKSHTKIGPWVE